jgi:hypothetical protein
MLPAQDSSIASNPTDPNGEATRMADFRSFHRVPRVLSLRGGERDVGGVVEVKELGSKSVRLHYRSGWSRVYLHFSRDGGATWTVKPGKVHP